MNYDLNKLIEGPMYEHLNAENRKKIRDYINISRDAHDINNIVFNFKSAEVLRLLCNTKEFIKSDPKNIKYKHMISCYNIAVEMRLDKRILPIIYFHDIFKYVDEELLPVDFKDNIINIYGDLKHGKMAAYFISNLFYNVYDSRIENMVFTNLAIKHGSPESGIIYIIDKLEKMYNNTYIEDSVDDDHMLNRKIITRVNLMNAINAFGYYDYLRFVNLNRSPLLYKTATLNYPIFANSEQVGWLWTDNIVGLFNINNKGYIINNPLLLIKYNMPTDVEEILLTLTSIMDSLSMNDNGKIPSSIFKIIIDDMIVDSEFKVLDPEYKKFYLELVNNY